MTPPTNPHAELVEALRPTNGWTYIEKDRWRCTKCAGPVLSMCGPPSILSHFADCPIRLALEYTPPPLPKLTPLPKYSASVVTHSDWVRNNYEALKRQQERPVEPSDTMNRFNDLYRWNCKATARMDELQQRLDALESRSQSEAPENAKPKPACDKCGDTKIISETKQLHFNHSVTDHKLCPCVKVGDVVSAEVANMLPVGSRIQGSTWSSDAEAFWQRTDSGWDGYSGGDTEPTSRSKAVNDSWMVDCQWRILRIGPAPEATTDHVADASKKVEPDKAEEIAESLLCGLQSLSSPISPESKSTVASFAAMLRVHGVGQPLPLADLLADPRLRPVMDIVEAAINHAHYGFTTRYILRKVVDALPPELRAAIEAVR